MVRLYNVVYVLLIVLGNLLGWVKLHLFLLFFVNFAQVLSKHEVRITYMYLYILYMSKRYFSI